MTCQLVTFFHDIERDLDNAVDSEACCRATTDFLGLETAHSVRATYDVVGRLLEEDPGLAPEIESTGSEIAFHSYGHAPDWNPSIYEDEVLRCRKGTVGEVLRYRPIGYRSPRSQWDRRTLRTLLARDFSWSAEADPAPTPYFIRPGLVRLPITLDDYALHTGAQTIEAWWSEFERALDERPYVAIGMHDCYAARDRRLLEAWNGALERVRDRRIPTATFGETASLIERGARGFLERAHAEPEPAIEIDLVDFVDLADFGEFGAGDRRRIAVAELFGPATPPADPSRPASLSTAPRPRGVAIVADLEGLDPRRVIDRLAARAYSLGIDRVVLRVGPDPSRTHPELLEIALHEARYSPAQGGLLWGRLPEPLDPAALERTSAFSLLAPARFESFEPARRAAELGRRRSFKDWIADSIPSSLLEAGRALRG